MKIETIFDGYCHVVIDMQRLFAEETVWHAPAMRDILENVIALSRRMPSETLFARFIVPASVDNASGCWKPYYERWSMLTGDHHDPALHDLMGPLRAIAPAGQIFDKPGYSIFSNETLHSRLQKNGVRTIIVSGAETDVCVYSSVLQAIDLGYLVVIATDAVASSDGAAHRAVIDQLAPRMPEQILLLSTEEILSAVDAAAARGTLTKG
ncbi:cysteine hydrolase [Neorhizobium sp. P12A]|uniref:cysteine hydrolase n=1 Tax=Neorhizobium sp. P12A TaxID=2268027 RepID=UPI0011EBAE68|nr:cysteine hydrolase [Neorhizobium sp. P12A]KAA0693651.1 cysteine hydrolase [Neorhizobium sp. P12A]